MTENGRSVLLRDARLLLPVSLLAALAIGACERTPPEGETDSVRFERYTDPAKVRSYPASAARINAWIAASDTAAIRQHGWDIWESITAMLAGGTPEPIWETWYSGHEIFEIDTVTATAALTAAGGDLSRLEIPRSAFAKMRHEIPLQTGHGRTAGAGQDRLPRDRIGSVFSFNRYTRTTARQIYGRKLWDFQVLKAINDSFNTAHTPVAQREVLVSVDSVDALSFVLKPVFQFIDGAEPSCIPYWAGDTPATTNSAGMNPVAREWKQFAVVDPQGKFDTPMSPTGVPILNCPSSEVAYPVVKLTNFYHRKLTQAMVDSFSLFAAGGSDDIGLGDSTAQSDIMEMVRPGNFGVLVAMHVTGKEIVNWTWQSFWWSPTPNDSLGFDRPKTIGAPWNNYQMTTAYYMTDPGNAGPKGTPRIAYNPYLETSLSGQVDTAGAPVQQWYGPTTNCMSCHRMASWKPGIDSTTNPSQPTPCFSGPARPYMPAGYIDAGNVQLLSGLTKTDFLWSVAIRTANVSQCPPPPAPRPVRGR